MIEVDDVGDSQPGDAFLAHPHQSIEQNASHDTDDDVTRGQAWCLYCSHFLSMWNSRIYEFGAVSRTTHGLYSLDSTLTVLPDSVHSVGIPRKSHGFIHQVSASKEPEPKAEF